MYFRVMWKFPGRPVQKADFDCDSVEKLLTLLDKREGVNEGTVQQLYIHEYRGENVIEHIHIDQHLPVPTIPRKLKESLWDDDQESVIEGVFKALQKEEEEVSPDKIIQSGLFYKAYPAKSI